MRILNPSMPGLHPAIARKLKQQEDQFELAIEERLKKLKQNQSGQEQRHKLLTTEEKGRQAIESLAKDVVEWNLRNGGQINTYEKAREYVTGLAHRHERRKV